MAKQSILGGVAVLIVAAFLVFLGVSYFGKPTVKSTPPVIVYDERPIYTTDYVYPVVDYGPLYVPGWWGYYGGGYGGGGGYGLPGWGGGHGGGGHWGGGGHGGGGGGHGGGGGGGGGGGHGGGGH